MTLSLTHPVKIDADLLVSCRLPTRYGDFTLSTLSADIDFADDHALLAYGKIDDGAPVLVRIHSECVTGDVFGSLRCDCGPQLDAAMKAIVSTGAGAIVYLRQEGRGIGLFNKIKAYSLQEAGADTVDANLMLGLPEDARRYEAAARLLRAAHIQAVRLMTNNPAKIAALEQLGLNVVERVRHHHGACRQNAGYLAAKLNRMGHMAD